MNDEQFITPETIEANKRWDAEIGQHTISMDPRVPLRARQFSNIVGAKLTDKKIEQYRQRGFYSQEFKEARKQHMARVSSKKPKRVGNFLLFSDGRQVYSPE